MLFLFIQFILVISCCIPITCILHLKYVFCLQANVQGNTSKAQLGVMFGVFLPSIQNVFGVVMFLRLSCFVGIMGTPQAFLMVFLCCLCVSYWPLVL